MDNEAHFYRCSTCGNVVTMMHDGGGKMFCCGHVMPELEGRTGGIGAHGHRLEVLHENGRLLVRVNDGEHPSERGHRIQWIALRTTHRLTFRYLKEGARSEAFFPDVQYGIAYCFCSIHKIWKIVF